MLLTSKQATAEIHSYHGQSTTAWAKQLQYALFSLPIRQSLKDGISLVAVGVH